MSEDFARHSLHSFVLSTLRSIDNEGAASRAVVETLVDIAQQYLSEVGRVASGNEQLAGRSRGSFFDAHQAILSAGGGYSIGTIVDTAKQRVPASLKLAQRDFPVHCARELPAKLSIGEDEPDAHEAHIPAWMPLFPQKHTYIHTDSKIEELEPVEVVKRKRETRDRLTQYLSELHKRSKVVAMVNPEAAVDKEEHEAQKLPSYAMQNPYVQSVAPYDPSKDPHVSRAVVEIDQQYSDRHGRDVNARRVGVHVSVAVPLESRDREEYAGILKAERLINSDHTQGLATSEADI